MKEEKATARILFVEDDKHVKDFAVTALKDFGYKVHSSINGKHALEHSTSDITYIKNDIS